MSRISIVYASDQNFLIQTYVSIYSVLSNRKKDYYIHFCILVPEECDALTYDFDWDYDNYEIEYINISKEYFQDVKITLQNISKPTFYRLLIPLLLCEYDKCIYLDGDTICCNDILELYNSDIEAYYFGAVKGMIMNLNVERVALILDVPSADDYINAGVLVMNLKKMRQDQMVDKFMEYCKKGYPCQDQDVLNKCCYGKIRILSPKYNIYCNAFVAPRNISLQRYSIDELNEAITNPTIIHYPREYSKPWKNENAAEGHRWWKYAEDALGVEKLLSLKNSANEWLKRYCYRDLFENVNSCSQVILFGFSEIGRLLCDEIDEKYPNKIKAFCDNDYAKHNHEYKGYKVIDVEQLVRDYKDALIVITSQNYSDNIKNQLLELKFKEDKLVIYRKKTIDYIYSFQNSSINEVCRDIALDKISLQDCIKSGVVEIQKYVLN